MKRILLLINLICLVTAQLYGQKEIDGQVLNSAGEPLPGVNVIIKGTTEGTITNVEGKFSIANVPEDGILVFSFIGMLTEEIPVGNQTQINITLVDDIVGLDEVVVIGYGSMKRRDLTGAVSSVKSEEIVKSPTPNPLEAIQGRVPGMDITRSSGSAGAGADVVIRGHRSIGDPDDEDEFKRVNKPLYIIDGVQGGSISDLNPNDIESIEVLKDASTTAIYGYQGAGGVIIITTKDAATGKVKVSYNGYYGINGLTPYPEGRLGDDYIQLRREAYRTRGQWESPDDDESIFTSEEWNAIQEDQWINWTDLMLTNGQIQNHQISVSGGTENTKTYFSAGYINEVGPLKDDYSRYHLRVKVDQIISEWLTAGIISQVTYIEQNKRKDAFGKANSAVPLGVPYDEDGNIVIYPTTDESFLSPLTDLRPNAAVDNVVSPKVLAQAYIQVNPLRGLSFRSNLSTNLEWKREGKYNDQYSQSQINTHYNQPEITAENSRYINWDNILTYTKDIKQHSFTLTALTSFTKDVFDDVYASGINQQLNSPLFYNLEGTDMYAMNSSYEGTQTFSYAGRLNYSYRGRYLLTATFRRDGASQLSPDHRWSSFPSVAVAWRVSDENWMENLSVVSNLKLRLSYGIAGNSSIPAYGTQNVIVPATNVSFGEESVPAYSFGEVLLSSDLTWERTATTDFGLDLGLLQNRINLTMDIYKTFTEGNLLKRALPVSSGGQISSNSTFSIWQNVGNTENKGIELALTTHNISKSNFKWVSTLTFSSNKERIVDLIDNQDIINGEENSLLIGHPIQSVYSYTKEGIWQIGDSLLMAGYPGNDFEAGDIRLADIDGNDTIDVDDRGYIGSKNPKWICGFENTFTYRSFDLSIYLFARWGQMIRNDLLGRYNPSGTGNGPAYIEYWTPENPTNDFPRPSQGFKISDYYGYQSLYFVDGSYFKIKNITLGYTLPKKWSQKILINNFRIYCTVSNILTIAKSHLVKYYDPENGGSEKLPMSKQIIFGVNVDF